MRDVSSWRNTLVRRLPDAGYDLPLGVSWTLIANVELGHWVVERLAPGESVEALPWILSGFEFPVANARGWGDNERALRARARHLFVDYRSPQAWQRDLVKYASVPDALRGYENTPQVRRKPTSVCSDRFDLYERTLNRPVLHRRQAILWAGEGAYEFEVRGQLEGVRFSPETILPPPHEHQYRRTPPTATATISAEEVPATEAASGPQVVTSTRLRVSLQVLCESAGQMDQRAQEAGIEPGHWLRRFERVRLQLRQIDGTLTDADELDIEGMLHLAGMVSSGKSTLMEVLAFWAASQGYHVTLVVGDVVGALRLAARLRALGVLASPVLGASGRATHLERLERALASEGERAEPQPFTWTREWNFLFEWLSTICPLEALRHGSRSPLPVGEQPCFSLRPHIPLVEQGEPRGEAPARPHAPRVCPLYRGCPWHKAARDLVDASVWVATLPSLVHTRVPTPLSEERLTMAELVCRKSDLVIVDEADRVQVQLDEMFNPHEVLVSEDARAFLAQTRSLANAQLDANGRRQLAQQDVDAWNHNHSLLQTATDRLYRSEFQRAPIQKWLKQLNYFTALTLLHSLADWLCGQKSKSGRRMRGARGDEAARRRLLNVFDQIADNPLDENEPIQGPLRKLFHPS